jgi:transcriptional regulator with XRE-family HTH domain
VTGLDGLTLGERVAELRRRRGISQKELAAEVRRSESWVSQVERGVMPIERLSVLQTLADALGVTVRDLRPEAIEPAAGLDRLPAARDLDKLRTVLTGHPALALLFARRRAAKPVDLAAVAARVEQAWELTHASRFIELTDALSVLIPELEEASRVAAEDQRPELHRLLAVAYQAAAAAFARQDEDDAAWLAADRAISAAERAGHPLDVAAGHFRMAHAFIGLRRNDQADRVAQVAADALRPRVEQRAAKPQELSMYGAMHLVMAIVSAREGDRTETREHINEARRIAARLGEDRNDYNTEFGPTNVELHAVSAAVDLGDAGEAIDLAAEIDASRLSPERQARFLIDVARAHAQRRHVGDATAALVQAERLAPEMVRGHIMARQTIRDLVQLTGRRTPEELGDLAQRAAATP